MANRCVVRRGSGRTFCTSWRWWTPSAAARLLPAAAIIPTAAITPLAPLVQPRCLTASPHGCQTQGGSGATYLDPKEAHPGALGRASAAPWLRRGCAGAVAAAAGFGRASKPQPAAAAMAAYVYTYTFSFMRGLLFVDEWGCFSLTRGLLFVNEGLR